MQGRIKMFNAAKAFGFIVGDDEKDYFFHVTSLQSDGYPSPGMSVSFTPSTGTKGLVANQIFIVSEAKNRPTFFCYGNTRIRLNNIKEYGIYEDECIYAPVFDSVTNEKCDMVRVKLSYSLGSYTRKFYFFDEVQDKFIWADKGKIVKTSEGKITYCEKGRIADESYERRPSERLLIRTYKDDEFFSFNREEEAEKGIDIYEKFKELDSYFL